MCQIDVKCNLLGFLLILFNKDLRVTNYNGLINKDLLILWSHEID